MKLPQLLTRKRLRATTARRVLGAAGHVVSNRGHHLGVDRIPSQADRIFDGDRIRPAMSNKDQAVNAQEGAAPLLGPADRGDFAGPA